MYCLVESSQFSWVYFFIHPFWKVIQINVGAPQKPSLTCKLSYVSLHINCIQMLISYIYIPKYKIIRCPSMVWGVINSIPSFLVITPDYRIFYSFLLATRYHTNHQFSIIFSRLSKPQSLSTWQFVPLSHHEERCLPTSHRHTNFGWRCVRARLMTTCSLRRQGTLWATVSCFWVNLQLGFFHACTHISHTMRGFGNIPKGVFLFLLHGGLTGSINSLQSWQGSSSMKGGQKGT